MILEQVFLYIVDLSIVSHHIRIYHLDHIYMDAFYFHVIDYSIYVDMILQVYKTAWNTILHQFALYKFLFQFLFIFLWKQWTIFKY